MSCTLLCVLAMVLNSCKKDEGLDDSHKASFIKFYGNSWPAVGNDFLETSDGGFIIVGTLRRSLLNTDIFLVKTDAFGNLEWETTYDANNLISDAGTGGLSLNDQGNSIQITNSGGYAILGTSTFLDSMDNNTPYTKMIFIETDARGFPVSWKTFGADKSSSRESGNALIKTLDGGYLCAGTAILEDTARGALHKFGGNDSWDQYFKKQGATGGEITGFVEFNDVVQDISGDFYAIGTADWTAGGDNDFEDGFQLGENMLVMKIFASNRVAVPATYGGPGADRGWHLMQTESGELILIGESGGLASNAGNGGQDVFYVNIPAPNVELTDPGWYGLIGGDDDDIGFSIDAAVANGGYVVAGSSESFENGVQQYMFKMTGSGGLQWEVDFGYLNFDESKAVLETNDGGYAFIGTASDQGENSVMCLVKTTSEGKVN